MQIYIDGTIDDRDIETMKEILSSALADNGITNESCEVSLTIVTEDEIRELNRDYRDNDSVTDVLSFPQFDDIDEIPDDMPTLIGDVVICDDKVKKQAEEYGHGYQRELMYLFTHSILHLIGYDHMTDEDKEKMRAEEEKILERVGIVR